MAGFYKQFVTKEGADLPDWRSEEAVAEFFTGIIEAEREKCPEADDCGMRGIVRNFSLVEMVEDGQRFNTSVVLEAHCYSAECPNPRNIFEPLRAAQQAPGVVLYNLGLASPPE